MNIDKAIKNLQEHSELVLVAKNPTLLASIKLGIEALKRIDDQRNGKVLPYERWLPGETEE